MIFETDSEHQYIRVIEQPDGDRALELNEGQATHSLYRPGSFLTDDVWDGYLVLPFAALSEAARSGSRSSATPPGPPPAPTATTSPIPRSTGSRSIPSSSEVGPRVLRHGLEREPDRPQRGRPAVAAPLRGRLRRDHGRRLSPALHPVLSRDEGVLRARPRPARARRGGDRQRRSSGGQRRPRAGPGARRWRRRSRPCSATRSSPRTRFCSAPTRRRRRRTSSARRATLPPELAQPSPGSRRRGSAQRLHGGAVYTDDKAPVEWLIDRSILGYAGERVELRSPRRCARAPSARRRRRDRRRTRSPGRPGR